MNITRAEFMNKVIEIYYRDNCNSTKEALDKAEKELNISKTQFINWFGKSCKRGRN